MNRQTLLILTTLTASSLGLTMGCKPSNVVPESKSEDSMATEGTQLDDSIDEEEWDNWLDNYKKAEGIEDDSSPTPEKSATTVTNTNTQSKPKGATKVLPSGKKIYISTYGAQGQVWGHVVMNGNSGHGTIHDANENTLSIRVTRHGNELFGIDQNGREYVFKI